MPPLVREMPESSFLPDSVTESVFLHRQLFPYAFNILIVGLVVMTCIVAYDSWGRNSTCSNKAL